MPDIPLTIRTRSPLWLIAMDRALSYFAGPVTGEDRAKPNRPRREGKTALVHIAGPLAKDDWVEFFGGTSAGKAQAWVQAAARDEEIDSIYLLVDSPGGEVAGTEELANEVAAAARIKPVHAHIDDLGASAAYWIASQATTITANATGEVGSIGTVAILQDWSEAFAKEGIQVHVVSSGEKKGSFALGSEITEDQIGDIQKRVDALAGQFKDAVAAGRSLDPDAVEAVADGRILGAAEALEAGLIDGISTKAGAFQGLRGSLDQAEARRRRRAAAQQEFLALKAKARWPL